MTPEELAKYRAEKREKEKQAAEARKRAEEAEENGRANRAHLAETVLREQIIPYFGQVKTAMVQGFSYEIVQNTQNEVVGVNIWTAYLERSRSLVDLIKFNFKILKRRDTTPTPI